MISTAYTIVMILVVLAAITVNPDCVSADDCKIVDYTDHVELMCVGSPVIAPILPQKLSPSQPVVTQEVSEKIVQQQPATDLDASKNGAQVSRKRKQLETIRALNFHRFDVTE